jgi:hypothetical protein
MQVCNGRLNRCQNGKKTRYSRGHLHMTEKNQQ